MRLASLLLANGFKSLRDPPIVRTVAVKGERNDRREVQSSIEHSVSRRPARNDLVPKDVKNLVFVRGLSWVTGVYEIKDYFNKFGQVESASIPLNRQTGMHSGFGFVKFSAETSLVNLFSDKNKHVIDSKAVDVLPKEQPIDYYLNEGKKRANTKRDMENETTLSNKQRGINQKDNGQRNSDQKYRSDRSNAQNSNVVPYAVLSFNPKFNKSERSNNWNSSINATRNDSNFKPNVNSVAKRPIANEFCKPMPETTIADRDLPPMSNQKGTVKEKRAYN